jgi:cytochrome c-type biogenesis protein CcmF
VHAFAQSSIGPFFAVFLGVITFFSVSLLFMRLEFLKSENKLDSMVSRESGFLFNNWILLASVFAVLWGTIFPVISKAIQNETVTVGAPYFNKVAIPIGLALLFLTGLGPLLAWRKTSFQSMKRNFTVPLAIAVMVGAVLFLTGVRHFYAWMSLFLATFVGICTLQEFYKGARTRQRTGGENFFRALYNLTMMNTRRYGGFVVHLGIVMLFVGFAGQAFQAQTKGLLSVGDELRVKDYVLRARSIVSGDTPNYAYQQIILDITKDGKPLGTLDPDRRFFKASQQPTSHVAIRSSFSEDLYTVLAGQDPDSGKSAVEVFVNPLVRWVWIGGFVMFFGTLLALVPSRAERQMAEIRQTQEVAVRATHAK